MWDPVSGEVVRALTGHRGWVRACAWSPDGWLATGGDDGVVRVWDSVTGAEIRGLGVVLAGPLGIGGYASWSSDGITRCVGEAWRCLRLKLPDGSLAPVQLTGLSHTPPVA